MAKYLDNVGLTHLWGKIKNTFSLKNHSHNEAYYTKSEIDTMIQGVSTRLVRYKETIFPTTNGQHTFTLKRGTYTPNSNFIDIYIDGIPQPKSAITENSESSFTIHSSFEILTTTQIEAIYMGFVSSQNSRAISPNTFNRYKETIFPSSNGQHTFNLTKGTYTPNNDLLDVIVDGIMQPASAVKEINSTSFSIDETFQITTSTQIDVVYMKLG